jgi:hypothetical protein
MPPADAPPRWHAFRLAKAGHAAEEYEDAFAAADGRFAVADGASEASFAADWARLLAEGFVAADGKPWQGLDWLPPLRQRWAAAVDGRALPWYAESKRDAGAYATLLGLVLQPAEGDKPGTWRALAVGDSCLFHTRGGRVLAAFPLESSTAFGTQPALLGSRAGGAEPQGEQAHGRYRAGDRFLLMTDALAQWFLAQDEQGASPAEGVAELLAAADPEATFAAWVGGRRGHGLRNDDVTLLIVDL